MLGIGNKVKEGGNFRETVASLGVVSDCKIIRRDRVRNSIR